MKKKTSRRYCIEQLEHRHLLTSDVVINEIHYDPPDKTEFSEYIELYNNSDAAIDLSGWEFTDGIRFQIPSGTTLESGAYLLVSQDPSTVRSVFGVDSIGPWDGTLKNSGERIRLRDRDGQLVDEVDYQRGFPWPTVGDAPGHSIELMHPDLENDIGGNWRRAEAETSTNTQLVSRGTTWHYLPGTQSPSSPPTAWQGADFDDAAWSSGNAPIGYGDSHVRTTLDMRGNYSTVYLRKTFELSGSDTSLRQQDLVFRAQFDDGFHLWINGERVLSENTSSLSSAPATTAASALENFEFVEFSLGAASGLLVDGTNVVAVQMMNASLSGSSDAWFDAELSLEAGGHSPASRNLAFQDNAAPAARRVSHGETAVRSNQPVVVSTKVTDDHGVQSVVLEYQVVTPGDYFGRYLKAGEDGVPVLNPRYDDPSEWTSITMLDAGQAGDSAADDDVFSAIIPADVQEHRHLVRYRIRVQDTFGAAANVPYEDDLQHNFSYFVYDDVPDWTAADQPGSTPEQTYRFDELNSVATYHLLTSPEDHVDSQHIPGTTTDSYLGSEYLWPGTLVYDGEVYDNIRYRARGGVWRYAMGKNMWKFDFNRGHGFQAKDNYGEEYSETWDKLNFSSLIQQGDFLHRGEQGLFESVGFKLFNLAGVESPNTHYVHFRVIDSAEEVTNNQFEGDFQGLYLAIEQPDGRMLEEHGLPDGNLYKIERHVGDSNNQGPTQVSDDSDVDEFIAGYRNGDPSAEWWQENLDLDRYYSYRTIVDGIHHYDIASGKNYYYYHNPETDKFQVHPWDLDLTWADNMAGNGNHDFLQDVARNPAFETDYQNRVRELRDLLFNDEQTGMLIDEFASMVYSPGELSLVDADRAMWDYNPILSSSNVNPSKGGHGRFYEQSETDDFAGMIQLMKDYVDERSTFLDRQQRLTERNAPQTPALTYTGDAGYAVNGLAFQTSNYDDPNDAGFAAMEWRIAEITDPNDPEFGSAPPMYEITPTFESGTLSTFANEWTVPAEELQTGSLYRVRVRMQNSDGIWSHWSEPVQFTSSDAVKADVADALRISEIHYNPADPSRAELAAGFTDSDDFEFIELVNVSDQTINLQNTSLQRVMYEGELQGVDFEFNATHELGSGEAILVVEDIDAFRFRYGADLPIGGQWAGKLGNGGEFVTLADDGTTIHAFEYEDAWHDATDGDGFSLELIDPTSDDANDWSQRLGWRASVQVGGSPGEVSSLAPIGTLAADFNGNGTVDFADFLILSTNFGSNEATREMGDANDDGLVDFADFLLLSTMFGNPPG